MRLRFSMLLPGLLLPVMLHSAGSGRVGQFVQILEQLRRDCRLPGLSGAVISRGRLVWKGGLGFIDRDRQVPADAGTRYHIASLTKTMSALLAMELVRGNRLNLRDRISVLSPGWTGAPDASLGQLLSHTASASGQVFFYDSIHFGVLTGILERASGLSFPSLLQQQLLRPLGMSNTLAGGVYDAQGRPQVTNFALPLSYRRQAWAAAELQHKGVTASYGVVSSVDDLVHFVRSLMPGGRFADTAALQFEPARTATGQKLPYGYGWFSGLWRGERVVWHYGWRTEGYSALIVMLPARETALILLSNGAGVSAPFSLGWGALELSPFAVEFLRHFGDLSGPPPLRLDLSAGVSAVFFQRDELLKQYDHLPAAWYYRLASEAMLSRWLDQPLRAEDLMELALAPGAPEALRVSRAVLIFCAASRRLELQQQAVRNARRLRRLNPADLQPLYYLGMMELRNGDSGRALQALLQLERVVSSGGFLPGYLRGWAAYYAGLLLLERDPVRGYRLLQRATRLLAARSRPGRELRRLLAGLKPVAGLFDTRTDFFFKKQLLTPR